MLLWSFVVVVLALEQTYGRTTNTSGVNLVFTTLEPGPHQLRDTNSSEPRHTIIPGFLLDLTDNTTDNDIPSLGSLLMHVLGHQVTGVYDNTTGLKGMNSSVDDMASLIADLQYVLQNTKPKQNTTAPTNISDTAASGAITTSGYVTTPPPISVSTNSSNLYDFHNLTDVIAVLHTTKVSDMSLSSLNIITSHIQTFIQREPIDVRNVTHVLTYLSHATLSNADTVEMLTSIVTSVIQNETTEEDEDLFGMMMPDLMFTMENVLSVTHPSDVVSFSTPEIEVSSAVIQSNESSDGFVVMETIIGRVTMPVIMVEDGRIRVTTIVYQNIQSRWTVQNSYSHAQLGSSYSHVQLGSSVMSVSLQRLHNTTSERLNISQSKCITMVLPTVVKGREKERLCTFWNFEKRMWDTTGGRVLTKNKSHTECQFDHLTNFAVLVLYLDHPIGLSRLQKQSMFILTVVGCSLSIICLGVCVILYIYLRLLCDEKILIHTNLCVALMLAQLVLVTSHGASRDSAACKTVAVLLHFLFMASFSWMMLEGLAVYLACTRGLYNYGDMRLKYFLVGWGLPAVIVVVSVGVQFPNYGETSDDSCWLSVKDGLIWAFVGPMLVVVVFNLFILCLVIKVFLTLRANSRKTQAAKLRASVRAMLTLLLLLSILFSFSRASVRAMVTLLPLLGVTWILSILVPLHYVFHYLFIIGNSIQGIIIFLLHGIGNEEVRKGLSERRKRHSTTSSESITTINSSHLMRFKHLLVPVETPNPVETLEVRDRRQAWTGI